MKDDVDGFLSGVERQGLHDSEGCFTLDWEQARKKLSEHRLKRTELTLVKLFQAAVAGGAEEVELELKPDRVRMEFKADRLPHPYQVGRCLQGQSYSRSDRPLHHLLCALLSSLGEDGWTITWGRVDGPRLALSARTLEVVGQSADKGAWQYVLSRPKRAIGPELEQLRQRAAHSSVPLKVNGQLLAPGRWPTPPAAPWSPTASPFYLAQRYLCDHPGSLHFATGNQGARSPRGTTWVKSRLQNEREAFAVDWVPPEQTFASPRPGQTVCRAAFAIPLALHGPCLLIFQKDGVLLDPVPHPSLRFGGVAMMTDDEVPTDLSEFRPRGELRTETALLAAHHWRQQLHLLATLVDEVPAPHLGRGFVLSRWPLASLFPGWAQLCQIALGQLAGASDLSGFENNLLRRIREALAQYETAT